MFQTINRLVESTYKVLPLSTKTGWSLHIDFFSKVAMKKGILNVHLVEIPTTNGGNSKKTLKSGELGHGSKSFSIVNTFALGEAFGNKASFVMFNNAIRIILDLGRPSRARRAAKNKFK